MATMADKSLKQLESFVLLPEMVLEKQISLEPTGIGFKVSKPSDFEYCPYCQLKSNSVHSTHIARIKDASIRGKMVILFVNKRRYRCKPCQKIFTEHFPGISLRKRHTHRYARELNWACNNFSDMSKVQKFVRSSPATCFKVRKEELSRKVKEITTTLPDKLGIDEHSLRKPKYQATQYATILVDHKNKKVFDLIDSRAKSDLISIFSKYRGHENVKWVTMDFSTTFKGVVRSCFPNAKIIADRFHAQRLFTRLVNRVRKKVTGDIRKNPVRKLLLRNDSNLQSFERRALKVWLLHNPQVKEVYDYKEAMRRMYRSKGIKMARKIFTNLIAKMSRSNNPYVQSLRKTLVTWRTEILAFHLCRLSNGRTEGFNRKAKLIQRRAYGLRNFENYRLSVLNTCRRGAP